MSYMIDKYNNGEVHTKDGAVGWLFDTGEFRPLMDDALSELMGAGLINEITVDKTRMVRKIYEEKALMAYIENQANRTQEQIDEEAVEMRAAFGEGERVINVFTGEETYL